MLRSKSGKCHALFCSLYKQGLKSVVHLINLLFICRALLEVFYREDKTKTG